MAKQKEIEELEVVDFNAQDFVPEDATEVEETVSVSGGVERERTMTENISNRLEKKIDKLIEEMAGVKSTLTEREKTEIVREEVIKQAMRTQDNAMNNIDKRVSKLEENQNKVTWLIISAVLLAIIGTVIGVNMIQ